MYQIYNVKKLRNIVNTMKKTKVLVIGDIMLDRFVYGSASRLSPEAPVPVLSIKRENTMLGGAGNVLSNLSGLDIQSNVITVIGNDDSGQSLKDHIQKYNIKTDYVLIDESRPTSIKTRFLAGNQQLMRSDYESTGPISQDMQDTLVEHASTLIPESRAIILSDYGKGVLTTHVITEIIKIAKLHDIPVLVDPKGNDYSLYKNASVITPNLKELGVAYGQEINKNDEDVSHAAQSVVASCDVDAIVVTRSEDGMSIIERGKTPEHLKTDALEVFDVSGAGDTVIATIGAGLASGATLTEAASLANIAGGVVVAKVGTAAIRNKELLERLDDIDADILSTQNNYSRGQQQDRIFQGRTGTWDEAKEYIEKWKARGLKVGFTNGCFDILHQGHTSYLNDARANCDRLVIGLNCDASVKRLKGEDRPVNTEHNRATVLAALGAVDLVVLFGMDSAESDMPVNLVKYLQPDVYIKGGDYTEDQLPEAPIVRAYGGDVLLMPLFDVRSTTETIKKIRA